MHTRTLGRGLEVSAVGLGCIGMSQSYGPNPGNRDDMIAVLRSAVDEGVTFYDTADHLDAGANALGLKVDPEALTSSTASGRGAAPMPCAW